MHSQARPRGFPDRGQPKWSDRHWEWGYDCPDSSIFWDFMEKVWNSYGRMDMYKHHIKKKQNIKHRSCSGETHFNLILLGTLITAVARVRQGMEPKLKGSSSW